MVQSGCRPGFLLEPREPVGVLRELGWKNLQRDLAAEPGVARPVNLPHSARTERSENLVGAQPGSDGKGHREGASLLRRILPPGAARSERLRARERHEPAAAALQIRPQR